MLTKKKRIQTPPAQRLEPDDGPAALLLATTGPAGTEPSLVKPPQPDLPAGWGRDLDAIEYEHTRRADPDPRDDEGQEIASLILTARSELAEECKL
jgi:hypothetical protein